MNILLVTTNFGFGPVSKLLTIIEKLKDSEHEMTFIGTGASLDFLRKSLLKDINFIDCDVETISKSEFIKLINNYGLMINVMNTHIQEFFSEKKLVNNVFIDSLNWMWNSPLLGVENSDIYFIQDVFLDHSKNSFMKNIEIIPPIIDIQKINNNQKNESGLKKILVNAAGIFTPNKIGNYGIDYLKYFIEIFKEAKLDTDYQIIIACNKEQFDSFNNRMESGKCVMKQFSHSEFIEEARNAYKILSTPGLTFYLESKYLGLDVFYLLPSNYSQALLLEKYIKEGKEGLNLSKFGQNYQIESGLEEELGVSAVRKSVEKIQKEFREKITAELENFIKSDDILKNGGEVIVKKLKERKLI